MTLRTLTHLVNGRLQGDDQPYHHVVTDTRLLQAGDVFLCLKGQKYDGHDFQQAAYDAGAVAVIAERTLSPSTRAILVNDTLQAYQDYARAQRALLQGPVVAISGSVGKTTLKEMLRTILASQMQVVASALNENNEIGVPKTLLQAVRQSAQATLVEMGAAGPGHLDPLMHCTQPTVSVLTGIGVGHIGDYPSRASLVQTKCALFTALAPEGVGVLSLDCADSRAYYEAHRQERSWVTVSFEDETADVYVLSWTSTPEATEITVRAQAQTWSCVIPVGGEAIARNAALAAGALVALQHPMSWWENALQHFQTLQGRMTWQKIDAAHTFILDCYNAQPVSMQNALHVLAQCATRRVAVLADMNGLGDYAEQAHHDIADLLKSLDLDAIFCIGPHSQIYRSVPGAQWFADKQQLQEALSAISGDEPVTVLFKGSRAWALETVAQNYRQRLVVAAGEHAHG